MFKISRFLIDVLEIQFHFVNVKPYLNQTQIEFIGFCQHLILEIRPQFDYQKLEIDYNTLSPFNITLQHLGSDG